jgi:hypothetical protein
MKGKTATSAAAGPNMEKKAFISFSPGMSSRTRTISPRTARTQLLLSNRRTFGLREILRERMTALEKRPMAIPARISLGK